jgi:hypothetical protein
MANLAVVLPNKERLVEDVVARVELATRGEEQTLEEEKEKVLLEYFREPWMGRTCREDDKNNLLHVLGKEKNSFLRDIVYPTSSLNRNRFHPLKAGVSYAHRVRQVAFSISLGRGFGWKDIDTEGNLKLEQVIPASQLRALFLSCSEHSYHEVSVVRIELCNLHLTSFPNNNSYAIHLTSNERVHLWPAQTQTRVKHWLSTGVHEYLLSSASNDTIHETLGVFWHGATPKLDYPLVCYECSPLSSIDRFEWQRNILTNFRECVETVTNDIFVYVPCVLRDEISNTYTYPNILSHYVFLHEEEIFEEERRLSQFDLSYIREVKGQHCYQLSPEKVAYLFNTVSQAHSSEHDVLLSASDDNTLGNLTFSITPRDPLLWIDSLSSSIHAHTSTLNPLQLHARFMITAVVL